MNDNGQDGATGRLRVRHLAAQITDLRRCRARVDQVSAHEPRS